MRMRNCFFIGLLLSSAFVSIVYSQDCEIPNGCRLEMIDGYYRRIRICSRSYFMVRINDDFYEFKFEEKLQNCNNSMFQRFFRWLFNYVELWMKKRRKVSR